MHDIGFEGLDHPPNLKPLAQIMSVLAGELFIAPDIDDIPLNPVRQTSRQTVHMVGDSPRPPITDIKNSQNSNLSVCTDTAKWPIDKNSQRFHQQPDHYRHHHCLKDIRHQITHTPGGNPCSPENSREVVGNKNHH